MFHAESQGRSMTVTMKGEQVFVDGVLVDWDIASLPDGRWHIITGHDGHTVEVVSRDAASGTYRIRINGKESEVRLQTPLERRLSLMGMDRASAGALRNVTAPMPGLITSVRVSAGEAVAAGAPLLVLEAMKMENVLQSPGDGMVAAVKVKAGDRVEKGQVLVEF